MQTTFEWCIFDALNSHDDMDLAIDQILKNWFAQGLNRGATKSLFHFLYLSGYDNTLIGQARHLVENDIPVPAFKILKIALKNKIKLNHEDIQFYLDQADQEEQNEILNHLDLDSLSPIFAHLRQEQIEKEFTNRRKEKKEIIQKIEILKTENLIEEEKKVFANVPSHLDSDQTILQLREDFQSRQANHFFKDEKKQNIKILKQKLSEPVTKVSEYEKNCIAIAKKHIELKEWISYSLCLSACYQSAKEVLELSPVSEKEEWLYLSLLDKTNNHILCLSKAQDMENKYGDDPQLMITCIYYQAISLYALGKTSQAMGHMASVLKYDLNFKIAKELYDEWNRDEK